jgi:hypothetical protein
MKQRREGRVAGDMYEIVEHDGSVIAQTPLSQARNDSKLAAAIKRNGWAEIPEA